MLNMVYVLFFSFLFFSFFVTGKDYPKMCKSFLSLEQVSYVQDTQFENS